MKWRSRTDPFKLGQPVVWMDLVLGLSFPERDAAGLLADVDGGETLA